MTATIQSRTIKLPMSSDEARDLIANAHPGRLYIVVQGSEEPEYIRIDAEQAHILAESEAGFFVRTRPSNPPDHEYGLVFDRHEDVLGHHYA